MFWELSIALVVVAIAILYTFRVIKRALTRLEEEEGVLRCHLCQQKKGNCSQDTSSGTFSKYSMS